MAVSEQIVQVINTLADKFGLVIDWSSHNIMPYLQDLIMRISYMEICKNIILIILGIICVIITKKLVNLCVKVCNEEEDVTELGIALIFGIVIGVMAAFVLIILGITGLPQSIFLPELTAYNYLMGAIQ